jgi:23S rRNA G2069 N7-methylase RlmK/C1962 C5-methylase RlmI
MDFNKKKVHFSEEIVSEYIYNIVDDKEYNEIKNYKTCNNNIDYINGRLRKKIKKLKKYIIKNRIYFLYNLFDDNIYDIDLILDCYDDIFH